MSTPAQHTSGPWQYGEFDGELLVATQNHYPAVQIARVSADIYRAGGDGSANAALIAAAPDLLAACELAVTRLHDNVYEGVRAAALAAIAKAKAGEPL